MVSNIDEIIVMAIRSTEVVGDNCIYLGDGQYDGGDKYVAYTITETPSFTKDSYLTLPPTPSSVKADVEVKYHSKHWNDVYSEGEKVGDIDKIGFAIDMAFNSPDYKGSAKLNSVNTSQGDEAEAIVTLSYTILCNY